MRSNPLLGAAILALGCCALAACGDAAPPEPGEGARGFVEVDDAGAAETPKTPALSGGPAGQTPDYGKAGGVGSVVYSEPGSPAAEQSDSEDVSSR